MKQIESDILYSKVTIQIPNVPSTYEEADKLMGETGGALAGWQADCLARNFLPRLYAAVAKLLNSKGFEHAVVKTVTETKKDADGTETSVDKSIYESDIKFIGRVFTSSPDTSDDPDAITMAWITRALNDKAKELPFYAEGDRSGSGKIGASYLEAANSIASGGDAAVDKAVSKIEANVPGYVVERDGNGRPTVEGIARGIVALDKKLKADALKARENLLGAEDEATAEE